MMLLTRLRMVYAFFRLVWDPNRTDEVFSLADELAASDRSMMHAIREHLAKSPTAAEALRTRRLIGVPNLSALRGLPEGTLGRAAAAFLDARGLDPKNLPERPARDEDEFLLAHLYESHDLWHVVTGFDTDVAGELGLQAFYAAQIQGPVPIALLAVGLINTLLFAMDDRNARLDAIARGWTSGKAAQQLFGVRWDELWERPLTDVRRELAIQPVDTHPAVRSAA